ncbi:PLP-dependent aspartate aminotransferase family protein [Halobacillus sp. A5]|uniref:trans-sulfuration enzyme family protein n=1 Tax=Halobacillus sp. A5 TaxID=2880263 RepID=UPI0020A63D52|nr:aminotransferase class I/II-fold pyridoxal phosphate-dependent enzyme [Halobacillus sp. A5]MCP3028611.1 aminotransferase class I/II-fold pyridoxal phosphate-dependent enzyme [Halobacillus sp. A5]
MFNYLGKVDVAVNYTDEQICTQLYDTPSRHHGAVSPPIYQTSLFAFETFEAFTEAQSAERENYVYTRGGNPTTEILEQKLAMLERGERCKCFGSGMGAISSVFLSLLQKGDHVLLVNNIYGPTQQLMKHLENFGIEHSYTENDVEAAIRPNTKLIYVESPGTMLMKVVDLMKVTALAMRHGIYTAIDNTWSTPIFQKPLTLGFDLSVHSLTKYIGGHSDIVGGAVIGSSKLIDRIFTYGYQLNGSVLSPHDASQVIKGLRTLPLRMKQHESNASQIIDFLQSRDEIKVIHHPSLQDRDITENQMSGFSGLLSFELKEGRFDHVASFINELNVFKIGVSWGGYESLVNSPVKRSNASELIKQGIDPGLIRLSIGLENPDDLIADLKNAFRASELIKP